MRIGRVWNDRLKIVPESATPTSGPAVGGLLESLGVRPLFVSSSSGSGEKRTVRVRRRRRTDSDGREDRERAEAPQRRRTEDRGRAAPPSRGSGGTGGSRPAGSIRLPSGGMSLSGGCGSRMLIMGGLLAVGLCLLVAILLLPSGDSGDISYAPPTQPIQDYQSPVPAAPTTPPEPFVPPEGSAEGQTWLVMLYQDADDKILEQDIYVDLNEAERAGSTENVHVLAQIDRFRTGYRGDGDWTTAKRFYVTQDDDLQRVGSQLIQDLGEVNMSDGATLVDFATWAIETFPADKHVLILSDHGMGWPGGWSDPAPGGRGDPSIPLSSALGDQLYLMELDDALGEIRDRTGVDKFELIGMDACLMGHLEVMAALEPHARYAVASQETEPALGWAYTGFLNTLNQYPGMDGADLGRFIVESYIRDDQRIVDDQARAEFLKQGSPMGGLAGLFGGVTSRQLTEQMERSITLSAMDLSAVPTLLDSVNELSFALQGARQETVARARTYAQSFTSVFGKNIPPSYIDLGSFAQLLKREINDAGVQDAADGVLASLDRAVIAEKHGPAKSGATGVSIYFPNSQLFKSPVTGPQSYTAVARRFSDDSLWDDYLVYHYTGRSFKKAAGQLAVPEESEPVTAPGAGRIELSPITVSDDVAAPGRPVLLSTDVSGDNIGYVYLFVGFYDQAARSIQVADRDYLESQDTREIDGVYYPDWGEGEFTMEFEWEPLVFAIDDGVNSVVTLFTPETYGATFEDATYTVDGTYTYADDGESRHARLYFRDGVLWQVFGFTGQGATGAPRQIIPQTGDRFTVLEKWLDLDQNGKVAQVATQDGGTLTFGDQMFTWQDLDAAPGAYIVGFAVEDLDGTATEAYTQVTVE